MADQDKGFIVRDLRRHAPVESSDYREETAAELAVPVTYDRRRGLVEERERESGGAGIGSVALALSILSLFVMPILFGVTGVILGFIARRRGAISLGSWAIGIGTISIIIGMFILPFF
ncbi:MAG: hypothetical protein Q8898_08730 [Bacillota bacterium]|nr:hypothetical protein [Bacillota bacterium]